MMTILEGDMRDMINSLGDESVDCVLTDPPYGETSLAWDKRVSGWPSLVRRVLKPSGSIWVFGSLRSLIETSADFSGFKMSHDVIWEKHNGTGLFNDRFRRVHEIAVHFYKDDVKWEDVFKSPQFTNDATARTVRKKGRPSQWIGATGETFYRSEDGGPRLQRSVLYARSEHMQGTGHPTAKPVMILEPLLRYACPVGGHVLDPFAGSGSTGIAAKMIGQHCTLIETNPEYIKAIKSRIENDVPLLGAIEAAGGLR
jgi:site-specific DNA-methyltransferase (adenine-specific)